MSIATFPASGKMITARRVVQTCVPLDDEKMTAADLLLVAAEAGSALGGCVLLNWIAALT